jgi:hypothetical protein
MMIHELWMDGNGHGLIESTILESASTEWEVSVSRPGFEQGFSEYTQHGHTLEFSSRFELETFKGKVRHVNFRLSCFVRQIWWWYWLDVKCVMSPGNLLGIREKETMSWSSNEINCSLHVFEDPVNVYNRFYAFPLQLNYTRICLRTSLEELLNEFATIC